MDFEIRKQKPRGGGSCVESGRNTSGSCDGLQHGDACERVGINLRTGSGGVTAGPTPQGAMQVRPAAGRLYPAAPGT